MEKATRNHTTIFPNKLWKFSGNIKVWNVELKTTIQQLICSITIKKKKKGNESQQTTERYFDLLRTGYTCCCIYASNARGKVVIDKKDDRSIRKMTGEERGWGGISIPNRFYRLDFKFALSSRRIISFLFTTDGQNVCSLQCIIFNMIFPIMV